jgi:hypothetical protein
MIIVKRPAGNNFFIKFIQFLPNFGPKKPQSTAQNCSQTAQNPYQDNLPGQIYPPYFTWFLPLAAAGGAG